MRLDDAPRDGKAYAHAAGFGGDERLEEPLGDFLRNTGPGVGHLHRDEAAVRRGADRQFLALALAHRFAGVAHQVGEHLLDLHAISKNEIGAGVELEHDPNPLLARSDQRQRAGLLDQLSDVLARLLGLAAHDKLAQMPDDLTCPQRLRGNLAQRLAQARRDRVWCVAQQSHTALRIVRDRRERLVQLMRERGGHFAELVEPGEPRQFRLHLPQPGF